jgi:hypothetical protein
MNEQFLETASLLLRQVKDTEIWWEGKGRERQTKEFRLMFTLPLPDKDRTIPPTKPDETVSVSLRTIKA